MYALFGRYSLCLLLFLASGICLSPIDAGSTEYNRYLVHIFKKYGNGGTMSFEGLEHLMYSLGLGQIEFDPMHTIDEHRAKGFDAIQLEKELDEQRYFEQQQKQLEPKVPEREEANVQIINEGQDSTTVSAQLKDDVVQQPPEVRGVIEKGILFEFKEMHDPKHRHPRDDDAATFMGPALPANVCLSPKSLLRLVYNHDSFHKRTQYKTVAAFPSPQQNHNIEEEYNEFVNTVKLTPDAFMKLCPALLAQIDQHVCVRPAPYEQNEDPKNMIWHAWIYASCSIFILSACGLLGILLVPLMKTVAYQEILKFLVAVAVGTLAGDALMHLLPHALLVEDHSTPGEADDANGTKHVHDNTPVWMCACAFTTALLMFILENLIPLLKGESDENHGHGHGHGHSHGHSHGKVPNPIATQPAIATSEVKEINVMLNELEKDKKKPSRPLTPVAFMVVIGDGLHNLTDGLAIGAAFATDPVTGMATAFAVLCHELPHELGDFALLLQTGVSLRRAVCLNIVSSVLSFVGMAVGLLIAGVHSSMTQWIYAGTAGSFLYIAFADLVPAMSAEGKRDLKNTTIQIVGIFVGGIIMLMIAINEDSLELLFK